MNVLRAASPPGAARHRADSVGSMAFLLDVSRRVLRAEEMDDPGLDPERHAHALRGLARINAWSGSARILWRGLAPLLRASPGAPLRILDVASGAGDVPIRLWQRARRAGLKVEIAGCDVSPTAVAFARQRAADVGAAVEFHVGDVLQGELPAGYDVVTCSLFLHHLEDDEAVGLLRRAAAAARRLVLVNDLSRTRGGFLMAWLGTRLLSRSAVVHVDGPRSVERAFTVAEARDLAQRAGLTGATVARRWPCRWLLRWARP